MKSFILVFLTCICYFPLSAQPPQEPKMALSPNAAGLGLYGDVPISYYTGTPGINIPLHEAVLQNFKLPISLSYHASGVRPDQHPGWVGLGWSLNAGGVITRTVKDIPDEKNSRDFNNKEEKTGFYYNYNTLNTSSWNQRSYLRQIAQDEYYSSKEKDTEPDVFSFNFLGYSGKFYLTHTGTWAVQCDKNIKVVFNNTFLQVPFDKRNTAFEYSDYSPSFSGFTIIGEDGTQYVFGENEKAIEYSINFFYQNTDEWTATAWYLTKIIIPTKQEINISYERGYFVCQMYQVTVGDLGTYAETKGGFGTTSTCGPSTGIKSYTEGKLMAPSYLKTISMDGTMITFDRSLSSELRFDINDTRFSSSYNNRTYLPILKGLANGHPQCLNQLQWYKLDKITVKNNFNSDIKTIDLTYNNVSNQRLMLLNVAESGKGSYTLKYYQPENLPPYLSNKTDHWGFYNNTEAPLDADKYYASRNANAAYLQYGTISKITYPTGGYTEFEFEPHQYRKQLSLKRWEECNDLGVNITAGGLRIKKIKTYPSSDHQPTVREYFYVSDYLQNKNNASKSSGVLGGQVQYYFKDYIVYAFNDKDARQKISSFNSFSVLPSCNNANGCPIGYTEVIEKREDNAFSRYVFTNFDNGYMDESADAIIQETRTPYESYTSKEQERGNLKLQEDYNGSGKRIKNKNIDYEKDNISSTNYVRCMNTRIDRVCKIAGNAFFDEGTSYKIYTYQMRPSSETETYYDPISESQLQTQTTNYVYNGQKLIQSVSTTNSDGYSLSTNYKYPSDFSTISPYKEMAAANILSEVVVKSLYKNGGWISDESSDYALQHSKFYKPINLKQKQANSKDIEVRAMYQYDNYGNIREIIKDNAEKTVYLWSYDYRYPIAEIKGVTYDEVKTKITGGEGAINLLALSTIPDMSLVEALRTSLPQYAQVTTYTYRPLVGILTMKDPRGITTAYDYDTFGRLVQVKQEDKILKEYKYNYKQ